MFGNLLRLSSQKAPLAVPKLCCFFPAGLSVFLSCAFPILLEEIAVDELGGLFLDQSSSPFKTKE